MPAESLKCSEPQARQRNAGHRCGVYMRRKRSVEAFATDLEHKQINAGYIYYLYYVCEWVKDPEWKTKSWSTIKSLQDVTHCPPSATNIFPIIIFILIYLKQYEQEKQQSNAMPKSKRRFFFFFLKLNEKISMDRKFLSNQNESPLTFNTN